ncbi:flavin reductase family protein [Actinomadura sp. WAC 06369]|uniref:flavin reductase family protein n=1 Tax=Actinomadura sp. WAC 06369 TaxID=2203193 RepID=UPI000F794093|nr:flavin reductase family protein [Actinomadura sp. WAC 06369]RSN67529.1 monooxygenase [Actinomadura sp. WAC 06369]
MTASARAPDEAAFRDALERFASGITVVTSIDAAGRPAGFACRSFASLSLDPPLVLFCVARTSTGWPKTAATGRFAVNVLAADQRDVCRAFAVSGGDAFAGLAWTRSPHGTAHLDGALATVDCTVADVHEAGDHLIVVGSVRELDARDGGGPLLHYRGDFHTSDHVAADA